MLYRFVGLERLLLESFNWSLERTSSWSEPMLAPRWVLTSSSDLLQVLRDTHMVNLVPVHTVGVGPCILVNILVREHSGSNHKVIGTREHETKRR